MSRVYGRVCRLRLAAQGVRGETDYAAAGSPLEFDVADGIQLSASDGLQEYGWIMLNGRQ
jgi:hypothetical protein